MTLSVARAEDMMKRANLEDLPIQLTICGGGNGAHVAAGYIASKGVQVNVLTRQPMKWSKTISVTTNESTWSHKGELHGDLQTVSADPADVIPGSSIIIIAAPANAHPDILNNIAPWLDEGVKIGALFAQGGFDWAVKHAIGEENFSRVGAIFGFQNIPWICKMKEYGKSARILGPKKELLLASYPVERKEELAKEMAGIFDIPCSVLPNFLNLTLTPSNQIIHPARYYAIFKDWDGERTYTKTELIEMKAMTLYADFDCLAAETLTALDNELQQIKWALLSRFPQLDLSFILPIADRIVRQYGNDVSDQSSLKAIFNTNVSYAPCGTPLSEVSPGQFQPAIGSRLFWEDVPFGLCILKNLAEMLNNFPTPAIDKMIRWHQQYMGIEFLSEDNQLNPHSIAFTGSPYKYGIHNIEELVSTCLPKTMLNYRHPSKL